MGGLKSDAMIVAGGVILVVLAAMYLKNKVGQVGGAVADAAAAVVPYVNPADSGNIINRGVSGLGSAVTGNDNWSLGTAIYDMTH